VDLRGTGGQFCAALRGSPDRQHALASGGGDRAFAANIFHEETAAQAKHLWAYTRFDAAADACLKSLDAPFVGHEVFYIAGPDTTMEAPTLDLARKFFPDVPVRGDLSGHKSFFDSSKAERMLGWKHPLP